MQEMCKINIYKNNISVYEQNMCVYIYQKLKNTREKKRTSEIKNNLKSHILTSHWNFRREKKI